ncbi:MAG TPA: DNA helicase, partial [Ureibacillus sp.]|nr:DNA helicase [Ureibacillus sp.]
MTSKQHPDRKSEQERLEFTKRYMDVVIKTAETSKDQFKKIMQETFGDEDWKESGRYAELLTTANFFDMSQAELESLKKAQSKPYFARVDFTRDENGI